MFGIERRAVPEDALLARYVGDRGYADCYTTTIDARVSHAQFVAAFYTTWLFKLERWILGWAVAKPSTDGQAALLSQGSIDAFSAWTVEDRAANELLMCDFRGDTRSWFRIVADADPRAAGTQLFFGSAVVARRHDVDGQVQLGSTYTALMAFHRIYSVLLLRAARSKLASDIR